MLPPHLLNALSTTAKLVAQLSFWAGFDVNVSEELNRGRPLVATRAGGIPLHIEHGKSRMSEHAKAGVSDEVGTLGNAVTWPGQKQAGIMRTVNKDSYGRQLIFMGKPNLKWFMNLTGGFPTS
ncbi:hypothetical protein HOY82DRAFT_599377 [Tuber indicum]|nr:hypothetical protein HOY82DRAFT_599377 [Tuber indicum]